MNFFRIATLQFDKCTTLNDLTERPWCPTKTAVDGEYTLNGNDWGYCDPR